MNAITARMAANTDAAERFIRSQEVQLSELQAQTVEMKNQTALMQRFLDRREQKQ
jgi:hypothetical protein